MDAFIFSAKKNSKYPSLKIFLQSSCFFVKMYDPLRFFTFHPFSKAFIINMYFCIDLSDVVDAIGGISIWGCVGKWGLIYILCIQTVYKPYTRGWMMLYFWFWLLTICCFESAIGCFESAIGCFESTADSLESTADSLESTWESDKVKTNA